MAKGKYAGKKVMNVKPMAVLLAVALLLGSAIGGTLAWFTDVTEEKVNTFTVGNIDIELDETDEPYKMVPGHTIHKDPYVTVKANSEKSYVFVEMVESDNFDNFMTYEMDAAWTKLSGDEKTAVYYLVQDATTADVVHKVLKDDQVKVKETVTKEMMDAFDKDGDGVYGEDNADPAKKEEKLPTLTVTAYAVQYYSTNNTPFDVAEAWATAKPAANS